MIKEKGKKAAFVRETYDSDIWKWEADNNNDLMLYMEIDDDDFLGVRGQNCFK